MKEDRANNIAEILSDNTRWHSHGRGISMETMKSEVNLIIEDFQDIDHNFSNHVRDYYELMMDYMGRQNLVSFVHTKEFF